MNFDRKRVAHHEAGHVVAAVCASIAALNTSRAVERVEIANHFHGLKTEYDGTPGRCNGLSRAVSPVIVRKFNLRAQPRHRIPVLRSRARWSIIFFLSGPYAELVSVGSSAHAWERELSGSETDFAMARQVFADLSQSGGRKVAWMTLHREARQFVCDHWLAIEKLAGVLIDAGSLNQDEVTSLVSPLLPDREFTLAA